MREIPLFERGNFMLHSGDTTDWRINCEKLCNGSIQTLAWMIASKCDPFGEVEGVPSGGVPLANELRQYVTAGPLLIVDDVLTTGDSMEAHRAGRDAMGFVIFNRSGESKLSWVRSLWDAGFA